MKKLLWKAKYEFYFRQDRKVREDYVTTDRDSLGDVVDAINKEREDQRTISDIITCTYLGEVIVND